MIIDELDDIKCEECYRLAIEDIAAFAIDPERLVKFEAENPEEAAEVRAIAAKVARYAPSQPAGVGQSLSHQGQGSVGLYDRTEIRGWPYKQITHVARQQHPPSRPKS